MSITSLWTPERLQQLAHSTKNADTLAKDCNVLDTFVNCIRFHHGQGNDLTEDPIETALVIREMGHVLGYRLPLVACACVVKGLFGDEIEPAVGIEFPDCIVMPVGNPEHQTTLINPESHPGFDCIRQSFYMLKTMANDLNQHNKPGDFYTHANTATVVMKICDQLKSDLRASSARKPADKSKNKKAK